jgi:hypothetical protein
MILYPIWKIVGAGRKSPRFYETQDSFERYFNRFKQHSFYKTTNWKAYQFSSNGWLEVPR